MQRVVLCLVVFAAVWCLCDAQCLVNKLCANNNDCTEAACSACVGGICQAGLPCFAECVVDTDCDQTSATCSLCTPVDPSRPTAMKTCGGVALPSATPSAFPTPSPSPAPVANCSDLVPPPIPCTSHANNWECTVGDFTLQETGNMNVPKYTFWRSSTTNGTNTTCHGSSSATYTTASYDSTNSTSEEEETSDYYYAVDGAAVMVGDQEDGCSGVYKVQFQKLYEVDSDGKKVSGSSVSLPSLDWLFSAPQVIIHDDDLCTQEVTFNVTWYEGGSHGHGVAAEETLVEDEEKCSEIRWSALTFVNHMYMGPDNDGLKFDVLVADYEWCSQDAGARLALEVQFHGDGALGGQEVNGTYVVSVGDAFLEVAGVAQQYPGGANVTVSVDYSGNNIVLVYDHFEESLLHDPKIGVLPAVPPPFCEADGDVCTFNDFALSVGTSGAPLMSFWLANDPADVYSLQLLGVSEVYSDTLEPVVGSFQNAADLTWKTSSPQWADADRTITDFQIFNDGEDAPWTSLALALALDGSSPSTSHVGLVVELDGYSFSGTAERPTQLNIALQLTGSRELQASSTAVVAGNGYLTLSGAFVTTQQQQQQRRSLSAPATTTEPLGARFAWDSAINVVFDAYDGGSASTLMMVTDLGVMTTADNPALPNSLEQVGPYAGQWGEDGTSGWWIALLVLALIGLLAVLFAVIFGGAWYHQKRRQQCDAATPTATDQLIGNDADDASDSPSPASSSDEESTVGVDTYGSINEA